MKILALDTATQVCSVALFNDHCIKCFCELSPREHTQCILPLVKKILKTQNIKLNMINIIAFNRGPGSFTGVRVGIGIAQGLALGAKLSMIGISSLLILAQEAWHKKAAKRVLVAVNARRGEIYWAEYQRNEKGTWYGAKTEALLSLDQVQHRIMNLNGKWFITGNAWKAYPELLELQDVNLTSTNITSSSAKHIIPLAFNTCNNKNIIVKNASPLYIYNEERWNKPS